MKTPDITIGDLSDLDAAKNLPADIKADIARLHERLFDWERLLPPPSERPPLDAARIAELLKG